MPQQTKEKQSIWDQFTRKYQLSKTLRFELKPIGNTQKMLKDNKVFEKDQTIDDSYNQAKFYFDTLHQRFIDATLAPEKVKKLMLDKFADFLEEQNEKLSRKRKELNEARNSKEKDQIDHIQKEINEIENIIENNKKEIYKEIHRLFDKEAEQWKREYEGKKLENGNKIKFSKSDKKQKGVKFFTAAGILQVLKYEFPESKNDEFQKNGWPSLYVREQENPGKSRYIFDSFNKFSGYLSKFQQTRDNLYADDGTSTAVSTRIVSNFEIFLANKKIFNEKYKNNHHEVGFDEIHIFEVNHYHNCFLQNDIEALDGEKNGQNSYNKIIGRINQHIKEYRDKQASEAKKNGHKNFKKSDYPLFKTLEKQILGRVEKEKLLIENIENKTEEEVFFERFQEFIDNNEKRFIKAKEFMNKFFDDEFLNAYNGVYLKNATINTISRRWFANSYNFERNLPQASKNKKEGDEPKVKKFVTLADVKNAAEQLEENPFKQSYYDEEVIKPEQGAWEQFLTVWKHEFIGLFDQDIKDKDRKVIRRCYQFALKDVKELQLYSFSEDQEKKNKEIAIIKNYSDASLRIFQMMKYLTLDERDIGKVTGQLNTDFYAGLDEYAKDFNFIKYYNAFRNFITKKPFDEESIKLNFDKGNLLGGFAESPKGNAQFCGYILKKSDRYFLAISKYTHFLDVDKYNLRTEKGNNCYEKLEYTSLNWGKNIAGGQVYSSFTKQEFGRSISYQDHKKQMNNSDHVVFVKKLIQEKYLKKFPKLEEFLTINYGNVKEMQDAFSKVQIGGVSFIPIKASWVDNQEIKEKDKIHQLFLFEILNRDLRDRSRSSKKNVHTLYWDAMFSDKNLQEITFDLLGNAEIFFRKATPNLPVRKNRNGQEYINKHGEKIVEGRRYSRDLIRFHAPISLNASRKTMRQGQFNRELNQLFAHNSSEVNIIGIDRGEKHLVYYSVINQSEEILDQGSLNEIQGVNYYKKLVEREKERFTNRQSWEPVAKIKDLKKGYVSQVVRKIADLVIQYNAIVVMEDLNMRFKQIRGGIERSIYQQLEKQLIDKFNYLIFKDCNPQEVGGVLKGYQLSAPFTSFEKMGKQTGIIFYTQADYTSITDPLTGFRKNIYISNSASQEKIKEAIQKFEAIGWDEQEQSYFFTYNPIDFVDEKYKDGILSNKRIIYAKVPRIRREKEPDGYWVYKIIDVNKQFRDLFDLWKFENLEIEDIKEEIARKEADRELNGKREFDGKERNFYESFIYLFNLVLQLRNSFSLQIKTKEGKVESIEEGVDFIASPVKPFFATAATDKGEILSKANFIGFKERIISVDQKRILDEFNGDANGAYNIARKGVIILERIKENSERPNLFISKYDWDNFVQK